MYGILGFTNKAFLFCRFNRKKRRIEANNWTFKTGKREFKGGKRKFQGRNRKYERGKWKFKRRKQKF